eukprot:g1927.t1
MKPTLRALPDTIVKKGSSAGVGKLAKSYGAKGVFLVTDATMVKIGIAGQIEESVKGAGLSYALYDGIVPNPTVSCIDEGIRRLQACGEGYVVVSLGGGSVMDSAKSITVCSTQGAAGTVSVRDFMGQPKLAGDTDRIDMKTLMPPKMATKPAPPIIAIPTTSGTGSETNGAAVVTDDATHKKLYFTHPFARAKAIILDPALTVGMPAYPTACCGIDVLAHALEAFTSNKANAVSDALALGAIKIVARWLPRVMRDLKDLDARAQMQVGSYMAAAAFDSAQLGLMHATGHQLTSLYGQPHGQTLATMMPHVMAFNIEGGAMIDKYAEVAAAFGVHDRTLSPAENARRAIDAVVRLSIDVGTAKSIQAMKGSEKDIPELVSRALTDICVFPAARPASRADLEDMFRAAMSNETLYPSATSKAKL